LTVTAAARTPFLMHKAGGKQPGEIPRNRIYLPNAIPAALNRCSSIVVPASNNEYYTEYYTFGSHPFSYSRDQSRIAAGLFLM